MNSNKFLLKNIENFDKLNKFIDEHKDNIQQILVSPEMIEYFEVSNGYCYKGIMVIQNNYISAKNIYFLMKSNRISFNIPCLCGIYPDEPHISKDLT